MDMIKAMKKIVIALIRIYQWCIAPLIGQCCRFYPSCSEYAAEALEKHGFWRGSWYSIKRIIRCNPWNPGGPDFP
jgi:putative membrane protein insertion efficiency factor